MGECLKLHNYSAFLMLQNNLLLALHNIGIVPVYDSAEVNVPVVGGHAGITILPLFSQVCSFLLITFSVF